MPYIHVVSVVHTCKSISSHVISNFIINTLITYIMISHIILYPGSLLSCNDTYIEVTHANDQCMLLDLEISSSTYFGSNAI